MIHTRRVQMRLWVPAAAAALAAGGVLGGLAVAGPAAAASSPHGTTVLTGRPPAAAPEQAVTADNGVVTHGSLAAGSRTVFLPDGSKGLLNAPAGFRPGARPSGSVLLKGTPPGA